MTNETLVGSISFSPMLSIAEALKGVAAFKGFIEGFQIVLGKDPHLTQDDFSQLLQSLLYLQKPVRPRGIPVDNSQPYKGDQIFAQKFRHAIRSLALARIILSTNSHHIFVFPLVY